jgi:hypothetical protein
VHFIEYNFVNKSTATRVSGHTKSTEEREMHSCFQAGNLPGKNHLGDVMVGCSIILKRILKKQNMRVWTRFVSHYGKMAGSCKYGMGFRVQ